MDPLPPSSPLPDCSAGDDEYFVINISGVKFEATRKTLTSIGGSRLAELALSRKADPSYRPLHGDFFFERHAAAFDVVLHFHRTGKLHVGGGLCGDLLKQELKFWNVDDSFVEQCCWDGYIDSLERPSDFSKLEAHFQTVGDRLKQQNHNFENSSILNRCCIELASAFDQPSSSALGKVLLLLCVVFTATSIGVVLAEPHFLQPTFESAAINGDSAVIEPDLLAQGKAQDETRLVGDVAFILSKVDLAVFVYFLIEFLVRLAVAPDKARFLASGQCIADIVCLLGQALRIIGRYLPDELGVDSQHYDSFRLGVRCLGILQLLRVVRLLHHSDMARVLMYTVITSLRELSVVVTFMTSFVIGFACLAHYAEETTFPTILHGCWWSLITLTTIGYGDVIPTTAWGRVVGSLCALGGIFILALTIPVLVSNFQVYFSHVRARKQWKKQCERAKQAKLFWKELPLLSKPTQGKPAHV